MRKGISLKNYIKMCSLATDLQREWKPEYDNLVKVDGLKQPVKLERGYENNTVKLVNGQVYNKQDVVWLPDLEDLIVWLGQQGYSQFELQKFFHFSLMPNVKYYASQQEVYLGIYMYYNFNKVWNGKEWILRPSKIE